MTLRRVHLIGKHLCVDAASASSEDSVVYSVLDGGVCLLELNRPDRLNALTNEMQCKYFEQLERADRDPAVKAIVVTGRGRGFCAGAEMELLQQIGTESGIAGPSRNVDQINSLSVLKPIIAAINGPTAGLGFVLALMCDIRFTIKDAKFTSAFARRGLVAEHGISWILPRVVGMSNAMDILLSSRVFLGDEAKEMGLVSKVYNDTQTLRKEAINYAREMVKYSSPASLAEIKNQLVCHSGASPREAFEESYSLMVKSFKHPDSKEGVKSYVEKRDPVFQGLAAGRIKHM